jgi:hypothetical protein
MVIEVRSKETCQNYRKDPYPTHHPSSTGGPETDDEI